MTDKVVIVTGANSGIGKVTVRSLAKKEAKVIMAYRDLHKCEAVIKNKWQKYNYFMGKEYLKI